MARGEKPTPHLPAFQNVANPVQIRGAAPHTGAPRHATLHRTMRALHELLALLAPPSCTACRTPLTAAGPLLCPACTRALPWLRGPGCPRCGLPRHRRGGCPAAGAAFALAWAPLAYDGVARELVKALKFRGALPVARLMAAQLAAGLPPALRGVDAVVPVPPHPGRRRRRGFDPADVLAKALAERLELPLAACLHRGGGRRQVGAGERARRDPGRLAVHASGAPERVLLVDDVHTTGATLDACARALMAAGSRGVVAATYARTL
jgi:predicted amidophosphoribosyltransferase